MSDRDNQPHNTAGDAVLRFAERIDIAIEIGDNMRRYQVVRDALGQLGTALDQMTPSQCRDVAAALRRAASLANRPDPV